MDEKSGLPVIPFASQKEWVAWLEAHHATAKGLWIKFAKKKSGVQTVVYLEAVETALCYGWIDGQAASFDETYSLQRFTPRTARSKWSKINTARALHLIEAGRMQSAGLAAIQQAQADGRWEQAYDSPRNATVPDDLQRALDENPAAAAFFSELTGSNRYAVLYRIQDAKKPETRARRIQQFVEKLARRETVFS